VPTAPPHDPLSTYPPSADWRIDPDKTTMGEMKAWFSTELVERLPAARLRYWT